MALTVAFLLVLTPIELGLLLRAARRAGGRRSLRSLPLVLAFRHPLERWWLAVPVLFAAALGFELYFRGYLLPRLPVSGWRAVPLSAALFAVQHYWQPFNWVLIFVLWLVITSLVVRSRILLTLAAVLA